MTLKITFTIKTKYSADETKKYIMKNFYFHNKNDVVAWSADFEETVNGKRRTFIEIAYDPTIHDFNKICEYISCIEDHQSKVITHDFNTQSDEGGYHIMEIKMTFVIKTSIPADAVEMNILKKFDFHNKDDVKAWSPDFEETVNGKRRTFINVIYDPAIHDLDEIYDYIVSFEDDQNKATSCENNDQLCICQCPYCYEIFAIAEGHFLF